MPVQVLSGITPVSIAVTWSGEISQAASKNRKRRGGSAKLTKTVTIGGDMLAVEGTDTEEVAKLIMATTELAGRHKASKAAHTSYPSLDPAMVLFQAIIQVGIGSVCNRLAERGADRLRIRVVAIAGRPIGDSPGHRLRRSKERLGEGLAAARLRRSLSITSTRAPFRSIAGRDNPSGPLHSRKSRPRTSSAPAGGDGAANGVRQKGLG